jgi:hypothetical protein
MDRKKDAETVQAYIDAGFSKTFAFASIGQNWEDHQEQIKEEQAFMLAQTTEDTKDIDFIDRVSKIDAKAKSANIEGLSWPIVVAAGGAESAPGAFLSALNQNQKTVEENQAITEEKKPGIIGKIFGKKKVAA